MAHKPCVRLHAEYKSNVSVLSVVLDLSSRFENSCDEKKQSEPCYIDIEEDTITYRTATSQAGFHLNHLQLFPASCRGLHWSAPSELHFSLQAENKQNKKPTIKCENGIISHIEGESCGISQDIVVNKIKQCQDRCYCAGCGRPVFASKSFFKRVLPLPSENWSDFAGIWFCHNHDHETGAKSQDASASAKAASSLPQASQAIHCQKQPKILSPRLEDCLVSNLYLLVDSTQVCQTTVGITPQTQRLVCMRCGNFFGFVKKTATVHHQEDGLESTGSGSVYKIYLHAIRFLSPVANITSKMDNTDQHILGIHQGFSDSVSESLVEEFLCQLLQDQNRQFTSYRFIVHSSHEEHSDNVPIVLLVWLIDENLHIFSSNCLISTKPSKTSEDHVSATCVLKFLYKGCFLDKKEATKNAAERSIFKMWERDNTVHGLDLPYPLCKQLLSLLMSSTKKLPLSQRSLNSFHVGYLHPRQVTQVTG